VGAEFLKADKGRKFKEGGEMKESKKMVGKELAFLKAKNAPKSMIKHEESEMKGMKKMAGGGITTAKMGTVKTAAPSRDGMAVKGKTKGTMVKMAASKPLGMKRGGKC
jgi:DNA uptake protein ComE-like DNA-binding protein